MEEFGRAVGALTKQKAATTVGVVVEVNGSTCKVERENLPELLDVRLQAIEGEFKTRFLVVPKIGSKVLCLEVANKPEETAIVKYTEIERVEVKIGGAEWLISSAGKFTLKNETADLKEILTTAFDTVSNATITTPNGVGAFAPTDKMKLADLKSKTLKLFE